MGHQPPDARYQASPTPTSVLCHSRQLYLEFTLSQAIGTFLRCMERGLRFFGGTTTVDIFDNMKTVVLSHTATATVFNPVPRLRPRARRLRRARLQRRSKANEKGRVERPIGFVRDASGPVAASRPARPQRAGHARGATTSPTTACTTRPARCPRSSSSTRRSACSSRCPRRPSTPTTSRPAA